MTQNRPWHSMCMCPLMPRHALGDCPGRRICPECDRGFTADEWDDRHTRADGEDIHQGCCTPCEDDS